MKKLLTIVLLLTLAACGKGPAGKDGTNGLNGVDGSKGDQGEVGQAGNNGKDGIDGQDGTSSITKVIKFCPNLVDSYGVAYSEQGLCIDNKVYAVYSANNLAALVELSYGTYSTTTPQGSNCTFVVDENTCNQ